MASQKLKTALSQLEQQAFSRQKVQKIQPIELKPVMLLRAKDEPLVREYLLATGLKSDCAPFDDVVRFLERHQRYQEALKLWEQARGYWEAALNTPESEWHKRKYQENLKAALENIKRLSALVSQ